MPTNEASATGCSRTTRRHRQPWSLIRTHATVISASRLAWVAALALTLVHGSVHAEGAAPGAETEAVEDSVACLPGSGVWQRDAAGDWELGGAYCVLPEHAGRKQPCYDFVTISRSGARIARTPRALNDCDLRPLGGITRLAIYFDDAEDGASGTEETGDKEDPDGAANAGDTEQAGGTESAQSRLLVVDPSSLKVVQAIPFQAPVGVSRGPNGQLVVRTPTRLAILEERNERLELTLDVAAKNPVHVRWQEQRFVVVEDARLRWWSLDSETGRPTGDPATTEFEEPLDDALWGIDGEGFVRSTSDGRRIAWYAYEAGEYSRFPIHSSVELRAIDGAPNLAAVGADGSSVRVLARWGPYYKGRYARKYWPIDPVPEGSSPLEGRHILLRDGDAALLTQGLSTKRAEVLDTSGLTWRRRGVIDLETNGSFVALDGNRATSMLSGDTPAIIVWNTLTRDPVERVDAERLAAASIDEVAVMTRSSDDAPWVVRDGDQSPAIWFGADDLRGPDADVDAPFAEASVTVDATHIFAELAGDGRHARAFHLLPATPDGKRLKLVPPTTVEDALSPVERWFGYCLPGDACARTVPPVERSDGGVEHWANVDTVEAPERPTYWALAFVAASILLLILVVVWRTDVGRNGHVHEQDFGDKDAQSHGTVLDSMDLGARSGVVDGRGRRYVTPRDRDEFVHSAWWSYLPWRVGIALAVGAAVAIPLGFSYLVKEPVAVSLPFWLALWCPPAVVAFIALSWSVWNRRHLLRFGHAYEGQWFDSGTSRASLCYTLPNGRMYQLKKGQWKRADLTPIVLVDPQRPRFAAQYTGSAQFPIASSREGEDLSGRSVTADALRFSVVAIVAGASLTGALWAFHSAFPEPLSSWTLANIEATAEREGVPALGPCLEACEEESEGARCFRQCQSRQMRTVFNEAGLDYEQPPDLMPGDFRADQVSRVERVRDILAATPDQTCDALATEIDEVPRWSAELEAAFRDVYSGELATSDETLAKHRARLEELGQEVFAPICHPSEACLTGNGDCPAPPECVGPVDDLRRAVCGFGLAMTPIEPEGTASKESEAAPGEGERPAP